MRQAHGDRVVVVRATATDVGEADGMISAMPGALLAVLTADCVPALLVAPRRHVAAVVHAGWRGTLSGIVLRAVETLRASFDVDVGEIEAALGPAIGGCCYEEEREIGDRFSARWGEPSPAVWQASGAKGRLDLRGANAQLLRRVGIPMTRIHTVGPCTRCAMADYFSHRGSNGHTGRQLSYIGWSA
jgi:YfiH family protein